MKILEENKIENSDLDTMADYAIYCNNVIENGQMPLSYSLWGIELEGWDNEEED